MEKKYDLKDRTYAFAVTIVKFCMPLYKKPEIKALINQLLRSGTAVGAIVAEADGARTRKDFGNKMTIARNEANETIYWLRLLIDSEVIHNRDNIVKAKNMIAEVNELSRIISAIVRKL